jgi:hypothetical protein
MKQMLYKMRMADYKPVHLVFIDETSKDERTYSRHMGHAKGRAISSVPFIRGKRYSLLPAMSVDGIFAQAIVKGSFDRKKFIRFLEKDVVSCSEAVSISTYTTIASSLYTVSWTSQCSGNG